MRAVDAMLATTAAEVGGDLDADLITVEVNGGMVTLRGTVHSPAHKEEAARTAWAAPGVQEVENLITVEP